MKRFELTKKSDRQGWWSLKDDLTGLVCEFETHKFNETQQFTIPDDFECDNPARLMSEIGDYMAINHYFIAMPIDSDSVRAYFAKMVRDNRERLGWTVYQLAKESGVQEITIHNIEKGKFDIKGETLIKLSTAMGMELKMFEV